MKDAKNQETQPDFCLTDFFKCHICLCSSALEGLGYGGGIGGHSVSY